MFTLAIGIALAAALCLALGTHLQHRVVADRSADAAAPAGPTTPHSHVLRRIFRSPLWLLGLVLLVLETVLNVIALGLAPVALIQPLGTLSLVAAVILSLRAARSKRTHQVKTRMTPGVLAGVVITIVSVGLFVVVSAKWSVEPEASPGRLLTLGCLLVVFSAVANTSTGHLARIACAGLLFGTVAASAHILLFTLPQAFDGAVFGPDLLPVVAVFAVLGVLLLVRAHPAVLRPERAPHETLAGRPAGAPSTVASFTSAPMRHGAAVTNERSWS